MSTLKLDNYLRTYRRQSGLSQPDVAFLLGVQDGAVVSRFEKRKRFPNVPTALALQAIWGVPISQLYAGTNTKVTNEIRKRMLELRSKLQAQEREGSEAQLREHKLRWLAGRIGPEPPAVTPNDRQHE
jgi:transcriptional regulator with XRE-family HTH domain